VKSPREKLAAWKCLGKAWAKTDEKKKEGRGERQRLVVAGLWKSIEEGKKNRLRPGKTYMTKGAKGGHPEKGILLFGETGNGGKEENYKGKRGGGILLPWGPCPGGDADEGSSLDRSGSRDLKVNPKKWRRPPPKKKGKKLLERGVCRKEENKERGSNTGETRNEKASIKREKKSHGRERKKEGNTRCFPARSSPNGGLPPFRRKRVRLPPKKKSLGQPKVWLDGKKGVPGRPALGEISRPKARGEK